MQNKKLAQADQFSTAIDDFKSVVESIDVISAVDILRIADPKKIKWLTDFGASVIHTTTPMSMSTDVETTVVKKSKSDFFKETLTEEEVEKISVALLEANFSASKALRLLKENGNRASISSVYRVLQKKKMPEVSDKYFKKTGNGYEANITIAGEPFTGEQTDDDDSTSESGEGEKGPPVLFKPTLRESVLELIDDNHQTDKKSPDPFIKKLSENQINICNRFLKQENGSIKRAFDLIIQEYGCGVVSIFDVFNVKYTDKGHVLDDDISVVVRSIMILYQYNIGTIANEVLDKCAVMIGHAQKRLIRNAAEKVGKTAIEIDDTFPGITLNNKPQFVVEDAIKEKLEEWQWNMLSAFIHLRVTPLYILDDDPNVVRRPVNMFDIFAVKRKHVKITKKDMAQLAVFVDRQMCKHDLLDIRDEIFNHTGIEMRISDIEDSIRSYNERKKKTLKEETQ